MTQTLERKSDLKYRQKLQVPPAGKVTQRKTRLVLKAAVNRGGGRCFHVQLAVKEKSGRSRGFAKALVWFAVKAVKVLAQLFWLLFLGGFLVLAGHFCFRCLKISGAFFFGLDNHKYLWYTSALWKRNP